MPQSGNNQRHDLIGNVSIVVPCHNEEMNVRPLYDGLCAQYDAYIREFVFVDDNSTDATATVIRELAQSDPRVVPVIRHPPGGVGLAIRDGLQAATSDVILTMDCDFANIIPEFQRLFDAMRSGTDMVIGSRFHRGSAVVGYPASKIICNRGFHLLATMLLCRRIHDVTNNLKLMRRPVKESLKLNESGFAVNAETGLQPILMGFACEEVPVSWINRTPGMGVSTFKLTKVGYGYARVLRKLALQTRFGSRPLARTHRS